MVCHRQQALHRDAALLCQHDWSLEVYLGAENAAMQLR
jgi:hypothetical protein